MPSLKQFGLSSTAVEEWLPWGGIVEPIIMKQKDGSMFCIIEYQPYTVDLNEEEENPVPRWSFRRGWVIWSERQHIRDEEAHEYLVLLWNPFYSQTQKNVQNALRPKISKEKTVSYFKKESSIILKDLQQVTEARFLEYQEIMDVLSFALSHGDDHQEMPEVPLYMDALLSGDIKFEFGANDIYINEKRLFLVSLFSPEPVDKLYDSLIHLNYRHTRRLLLFNDKEAVKDLTKYTRTWFPSRKVLRKAALEDLLGNYNGYYMETFQFLLDDDTYDKFKRFFQNQLDVLGYSYIFESYNIKECFWGSIPGLFLANTRPPVMGFAYLAEFLHGYIKELEDHTDILEDAKANLIPTSVDISDYLSFEQDDLSPIEKERHVEEIPNKKRKKKGR